jgi:hypothetical protein
LVKPHFKKMSIAHLQKQTAPRRFRWVLRQPVQSGCLRAVFDGIHDGQSIALAERMIRARRIGGTRDCFTVQLKNRVNQAHQTLLRKQPFDFVAG